MKTTAPFQSVGVAGAGSWGTALALVLHARGYAPVVWGHDPEHIAQTNAHRENRLYLPGVALPAEVAFTASADDLRECELLLIVVPSKAIREVVGRLASIGLREKALLLSCTKGIERGTGLRMSEIIRESLPGHPIAALSGPSHAEEVARGMPTAVVIGSDDAAAAEAAQEALSTGYFRAYSSDDIAGIELGGALKNIFAIAAGVCDGLQLGDNSKAALVTRGLAELIRIGEKLGGRTETFHGLSGVGDLVVTCFSRHSRNRLVGERLGRGERLAEIAASMQMIAEGVPTTYSVHECAVRLGLETPIIGQIRALLEGAVSAEDALRNLLSRDIKAETTR
jgi:glycerol-3-phosphate dehydrogenase (NAD(P)+)